MFTEILYVHRIQYYIAVKMNKLWLHTSSWMNLRNIVWVTKTNYKSVTPFKQNPKSCKSKYGELYDS